MMTTLAFVVVLAIQVKKSPSKRYDVRIVLLDQFLTIQEMAFCAHVTMKSFLIFVILICAPLLSTDKSVIFVLPC